jgi:hypothetical protein
MSITVTSNQLRSLIAQLEKARDLAKEQFPDSLFVFPDDEKPLPAVLASAAERCEMQITALQTALQDYNLRIRVKVGGSTITLAEAIKRKGALERMETLWGSAVAQKTDSYRDKTVRDPMQERAKPAIKPSAAKAEVLRLSNLRRALMAAVNDANSTLLVLDGYDESLLVGPTE